ncbi:helix-turn-helix domain-containing protein [Ligilactobacillus aviarius]|uniref:helix-turn-helix domain-containing protein n=1 Tax=Ligilactobacillus aviarius TaxID=1606 RepID=UPI00249EBF43|nr:helix-turn-helix transcriptional regulator [Ligilactobacillus aviarius]
MIPNFGEVIRKRRKKLKMTIEQLAEKADVSVSLISLIERQKLTDLKVSNLERICDALKMDITDFFKESIDSNNDFQIFKDIFTQLSPSTIKLISELKNLDPNKQEKFSEGILTIFSKDKK